MEHGKQPGPMHYLSPSEETELASHLIEAANIDMSKSLKKKKYEKC